MDLFAKYHPLEAAALRMRSVKPFLRSFKLEELRPQHATESTENYCLSPKKRMTIVRQKMMMRAMLANMRNSLSAARI